MTEPDVTLTDYALGIECLILCGVETCYPQFTEFLRLKRKYDPHKRFQSEWYRHYRGMFG